MKLDQLNKAVHEQIIHEYPDWDTEGMKFYNKKTGRSFKDIQELTYHVVNSMFDQFDDTLLHIHRES